MIVINKFCPLDFYENRRLIWIETNIYFQKIIQGENINDILLQTAKSVFLLSFFIIFSRLVVTHLLLYSLSLCLMLCLNKCVPSKTTCTHNYVVSLKKTFFWKCCFMQWLLLFGNNGNRPDASTFYNIWNWKNDKYASIERLIVKLHRLFKSKIVATFVTQKWNVLHNC